MGLTMLNVEQQQQQMNLLWIKPSGRAEPETEEPNEMKTSAT